MNLYFVNVRRGANPARECRRPLGGYLLIEYMIYMAVLAVVMGLAFGSFYRSLDNTRDFGRSTEEILTAINAGELWRADVRGALALPRFVKEGALSACEITKEGGVVAYFLADGAVWRKEGNGAVRQVLARVKDSKMSLEKGQHVTFCRWELELATRKKNPRVKPLFTFEAVPGKGAL